MTSNDDIGGFWEKIDKYVKLDVMVRGSSKIHFGWLVVFVLVMVVATVVVKKWDWIRDYYRGRTYEPSAEMVRIRDDLDLTGRGEFLFNASQPELNESEEFNSYCRSLNKEIAVLGCYITDDIHIYNITDKQLDGIRELTTAHELLHAVFARMSEEEREALKAELESVYAENENILKDELNTYSSSERFEELYVRAGTEIANLPESLEKHYGEVFADQDSVVAFYNKYIAVFRELESELDTLGAEIEDINNEITQLTNEYETRSNQLNAEITNFNQCAETAGCFNTESDFYDRRAVLVAERESLEELYNRIGGLIDGYNAKVEVYNADVLRSEDLNTIINSNSKPQEIK